MGNRYLYMESGKQKVENGKWEVESRNLEVERKCGKWEGRKQKM